jgi:prolipoprotein diacylglyceryltransferase
LATISARAALIVHATFETLAYGIGLVLLWRSRRLEGPAPSSSPRLPLILGASLGALAGARLLSWLEARVAPDSVSGLPTFLFGGKTIVGGLLGAWIGVEIVKRRIALRRSTGDVFVPALLAGLAIGRLGCFLAGRYDGTSGLPTLLPWGVDFGDGIRRHPTQLYEVLFVALLAAVVGLAARSPRPEGELFLLTVAGYLSFRVAVDFLKPRPVLAFGLDAIQAAAILGAGAALIVLVRRRASALSAREGVHA